MKNKVKLFLVLMIGLIVLPISVYAKTYNTLDLRETLADDGIEESFTNYNPNKDAITIYLFRGKGCGYCHAFLEFMNSITEEYGKYFKMTSYEVWNDSENAALMDEVSNYLDNPAGGVPYIVIGDKVFAGYASEYDEGIKEAIKTLYDTKKKDRYDVFTEMKKHPKKTENANSSDVNKILIWNIAFIALAAIILIFYTNMKFKEISLKLDKIIDNKTIKVETEKPKKVESEKPKKTSTPKEKKTSKSKK